MRLKTLNLNKYGMFTDRVLDFGNHEQGQPDFHIIYGLNEAGKSTALSAWNDFLFGIKHGSPFGFLHSNAMEIGAELESENEVLAFTRLRKRNNSLFNSHGEGLDEIQLQRLLGGFSRDDYEKLFSLNEEILEKGGNDILASKGDLGRMLFSASTGLLEITQRMEDKKKEIENFYKTRGRTTQLNGIKNNMSELKHRWIELDVDAGEYKRLSTEYADLQKALNEARKKKAETDTELENAKKQLDGLPLRADYIAQDTKLNAIQQLPKPPANWRVKVEEFSDNLIKAKTYIEQTRKELDNIFMEQESHPIDPIALQLKGEIEIAQDLKSSFLEARKDIPKREQEYQEVLTDLKFLAKGLGIDFNPNDANYFVADRITIFRTLIEEHSGVIANYENRREAYEKQKVIVSGFAAKLEGISLVPEHIKILEIHLGHFRENDPSARLQLIQDRISEDEDKIASLFQDLSPWSGAESELEEIVTPKIRTLRNLDQKKQEEIQHCKSLQQQFSLLESEQKELESTLNDNIKLPEVTLDDLASSRKKRDTLWSEHKRELDSATADAFETAMYRDDEITKQKGELESQGKLNAEHQRQLNKLKKEITNTKNKILQSDELIASLIKEYEEYWITTTGVSGTIPEVDEFIDWIETRNQIVESIRNRNSLLRSEKALLSKRNNLSEKILIALEKLDSKPSVSLSAKELGRYADETVKNLRQLLAQSEEMVRAKLEETRRKLEFQEAEKKLHDWNKDWKSACENSPFQFDETPTTVEIREKIQLVEKYNPLLKELENLAHRISSMTANRERFENNVSKLADKLDLSSNSNNLLEVWEKISTRADKAVKNHEYQEKLDSEAERLQKNLKFRQDEIEETQALISEMGKPYKVNDLVELKKILEDAAEYEQLHLRREESLERIRQIIQKNSNEEALAEIVELDEGELRVKIDQLKNDSNEYQFEIENIVSKKRELELQLEAINDDGEVAKLKEKHANLQMLLEQEVKTHLRKKFGIILLEQAIKRYRDVHKSEMMNLASKTFSAISMGRYHSLGTALQKEQEVLIVNSADGGTKYVEQLSEGTRFQLYLALRIAGYYEVLKKSSPVPFVADDILVTFDNQRTKETLKVLETMSRKGQVIYFTHHKHLCEIANQSYQSVKIQEL